MATSIPAVSIIVPAYNAEKTIRPLLDSLTELDYPDYEVIVVNDGSKDRTGEIARGYLVRVMDQKNLGASAARDAGLRAASGEIVAYVDSDVSVTRDWLRRLVQAFADPTVAAVTGRTIFRSNEKCASWMRSVDIARRNARRHTYTRLANGPNCAFRKDILLEVGGFNPKWYHAEDTEVSYRIWQRGFRIQFVPEAIVYHVPEDDWRTYARKRYRDAKAFTRMLARYTRQAVLEDDFVTLDMKIQPPVFLAILFLGALAIILLPSPWVVFPLLGLVALALLAVVLILPEAIAVARASRRPAFFFGGMALCLLRGFAWGLGLGAGGMAQIRRG